MRRVAAIALGIIGDVSSVPHLAGALHDSNCDVRESTVAALGKIGDAQAIHHLLQILWNSDLSSAAVLAIGEVVDRIREADLGRRIVSELRRRMMIDKLTRSNAASAFGVLERIWNRLSILEVQALPLNDPLLL